MHNFVYVYQYLSKDPHPPGYLPPWYAATAVSLLNMLLPQRPSYYSFPIYLKCCL